VYRLTGDEAPASDTTTSEAAIKAPAVQIVRIRTMHLL
jgi:hypothetical protein